MKERLFVDGPLLVRVLEQRLDLGGEDEPSVMNAVVERLDADAVPDKPQLPRSSVPQRDGEHPAEPFEAVDSPLFEGVQDDLGVGVVGLPAMSADRFKLRADLRMVVDLAVEDDPEGAVLVRSSADSPTSERSMIESRRYPSPNRPSGRIQHPAPSGPR